MMLRYITIISTIISACVMCMCGVSFAAKEKVLSELDAIKEYVQAEKYEQALNALDLAKWDIYECARKKDKPELNGNQYINHYYKIQLINPVKEWRLKLIPEPTIPQKKNKVVQDLVKIENTQSPYGLVEQIVFSVYDVAHSSDAAIVEQMDFKPELYVDRFAEQILKRVNVRDSEVVKKEKCMIAGNPAVRFIVNTDMGYKRMITNEHCFIYVEQLHYILMCVFVMHEENAGVYEKIFDEITERMKVGTGYDVPSVLEQKSFMDIYLEREKNKT